MCRITVKWIAHILEFIFYLFENETVSTNKMTGELIFYLIFPFENGIFASKYYSKLFIDKQLSVCN